MILKYKFVWLAAFVLLILYLIYFSFGLGHQRSLIQLSKEEYKIKNLVKHYYPNDNIEFKHDFFAIKNKRSDGIFQISINYYSHPIWIDSIETAKRKTIVKMLVAILSYKYNYKGISFYYQFYNNKNDLIPVFYKNETITIN